MSSASCADTESNVKDVAKLTLKAAIYRLRLNAKSSEKLITSKEMHRAIKKYDNSTKCAVRPTVHQLYVQNETPTFHRILVNVNSDKKLLAPLEAY